MRRVTKAKTPTATTKRTFFSDVVFIKRMNNTLCFPPISRLYLVINITELLLLNNEFCHPQWKSSNFNIDVASAAFLPEKTDWPYLFLALSDFLFISVLITSVDCVCGCNHIWSLHNLTHVNSEMCSACPQMHLTNIEKCVAVINIWINAEGQTEGFCCRLWIHSYIDMWIWTGCSFYIR